MLPQEIIAHKRDGRELSVDEITRFVAGISDGSIVDAQVGAFAMAVVLRGMSAAETVALTLAMRDSGRILRWDDLPGPSLDKHSTGGVGDKVSLVLAPILAACGAYVPMLSGRGLGHTGGTLDKLESIPGYDVAPHAARLHAVVRNAGCAIVGQTGDLAPADRRLYAIRDVTATVESIPLITASILSKKLAAGPQAFVMDVKFGSGAFMVAIDRARELARSIVTVAEGAGLRTVALLSDMDQCLGRSAGNALEIREAIAMLRGAAADPRLRELTLATADELLRMAGIAASPERALTSGAAAERFARMIEGLGGPGDLLERPDAYLPAAPVIRAVLPDEPGHVSTVDLRMLGIAIVRLGGGRTRPDMRVDHAVGLDEVAGIGEAVGAGRPLAIVHARTEAAARQAEHELRAAFRIGDATQAGPVVRERLVAQA